MKTVWLVNQYAIKPDEPGGTRHASLAKHLTQHGWNSYIIAGSILHLENTQRLAPGENHRLERVGDTRFLWLRNTPYSGKLLERFRSMLAFTWQLLTSRAVRSLPKPDVIVGSTVHPLAAWAASQLARKFGVPFIFEIRDLWPETLIQTGLISRRSPVAWAMYRLEAHLCSRAARVIFTMRGAETYLREKGVRAEKLRWVPNGVELENFLTRAYREEGIFRFFFVGSLVPIVALDKVLDGWAHVERKLGRDCPELHFVGEGPMKQPLSRRCLMLGLEHVHFHPAVAKREIPERCREANAFILTAQDLPGLYRYGISQNKSYDYMAMGRPILMFSGLRDNLVTESGAGISIPSFEPEQIADGIVRMISLPASECARMGMLGRQHVARIHSFERIATQLASLMEEITTGPMPTGPARPVEPPAADETPATTETASDDVQSDNPTPSNIAS
jgi:glycosyltransferase involved in cell wall biosynthesis